MEARVDADLVWAVLAWEKADDGTLAERQDARENLHAAIAAWRKEGGDRMIRRES